MGFCVFNRKDLADLFEKQKIDEAYKKYIDYPFLPVGLLVDELEKRKKKDTLPQQLIDFVNGMPEQVLPIPLTSHDLVKALQNEEFSNRYVSSQSNPFALISEVCLFDDSVEWTEKNELYESLHQIEWL
jgi:hypothetical protein